MKLRSSVVALLLVFLLQAQLAALNAEQTPEIRRAIPVSSTNALTSPQGATQIEPAPEDIRIAPITSSDPAKMAEAELAVADGFCSREQPAVAVLEYEKFLQMTSPGQPHRDQALFRLGECRRKLGNDFAAQDAFQQLLKETPSGNYAAAAAYRLGEYYQGNKENKNAMDSFVQAANLSSDSKIIAEASVKAGLMAYSLGKKEDAEQFFTKAADLPGADQWGGNAALGLMKLAYETKDYQKILKRSDQALALSNPEGRSQALLLTAQARRQLGDLKGALPLYDQIIREFPTSAAAHDGAFARLLILQATHDPTLLPQIEAFLAAAPDLHQQAQARLLKAEVLFQSGKYAPAAEVYGSLKTADLSSELKADVLYKEAWCLAQTGETQKALPLLSAWMTTVPQSPQMPTALIQRAVLEQKINDLPAAIADYSSVIAHYLTAPERELALQQKALLQGQQQDNKGMVETFQQLLQAYPKTTAAAQANFWIGWSSFESKDYAAAISYLEKARELDSKHFGERAGLRLLLCHYYLEQVSAALQEATTLQSQALPMEVVQWLGLKAYERDDFAQAERWLTAVTKSGKPNLMTPDVETALAKILLKEEKFAEAEIPAEKSLELARDPSSRAEANLTLASIQKGLKDYNKATALVQEALLLQPEGKLNIKARLLLGDLLFAQKNYDAAARAYRAVALLTEDPKATSQALHKAADAYRLANNPVEAQKALEELVK